MERICQTELMEALDKAAVTRILALLEDRYLEVWGRLA